MRVSFIEGATLSNYGLLRFSELALLLPNTDIEMVLFGEPARKLVLQAKKQYPGSVATNEFVWKYTAPSKCGGGSIAIKIYTENGDWTRSVAINGDSPDAMVGMNAGILAYQNWGDPVIFTAM